MIEQVCSGQGCTRVPPGYLRRAPDDQAMDWGQYYPDAPRSQRRGGATLQRSDSEAYEPSVLESLAPVGLVALGAGLGSLLWMIARRG